MQMDGHCSSVDDRCLEDTQYGQGVEGEIGTEPATSSRLGQGARSLEDLRRLEVEESEGEGEGGD